MHVRHRNHRGIFRTQRCRARAFPGQRSKVVITRAYQGSLVFNKEGNGKNPS